MHRTQWEMRARTSLILAAGLLVLAFAPGMTSGAYSTSRISVEPDGGYSGIVVKIRDSVSEDQCSNILQNLKVRRKALEIQTNIYQRLPLPNWDECIFLLPGMQIFCRRYRGMPDFCSLFHFPINQLLPFDGWLADFSFLAIWQAAKSV